MFVQIIEGRTNDAKALAERGEAWQSDVGAGAVGFLGVTAGASTPKAWHFACSWVWERELKEVHAYANAAPVRSAHR